MRICFVHEEYPEETNFGGIATYQRVMAHELVKQGNEVYVICRGLSKSYEYIDNGVHVIRIFEPVCNNQIQYYVGYRKKVARKLKYLQDKELINIIEVPDWGAETVYFESYRRIPLVVRLHTPLKVWLKYNKNNFGDITKLMLKWENKMIKSANLVTCCSGALKKHIIKDFDINEKEIIVISNPANVEKFYRDISVKKRDELLFVGSLEERKGVLVLAQALNIVFDKYPHLRINFIGKDTDRNEKNISTIDLIKEIVNEEYVDNLNFVGQIQNYELNYYLNRSRVGIFPSLFDNFPYVVLESMATGLHIVGSSNSGMVEMLDDDEIIYNTGDYNDLAKKIIKSYERSLSMQYNLRNIAIVNNVFRADIICKEMFELYKEVVNNFNGKQIGFDEINFVMKRITKEKIVSYSKEKSGVANAVFKVITDNNQYIVKKYLYNYDFSVSRELYSVYENNSIKCCRPLNNRLIKYKGIRYNVFSYIKHNMISGNIDLFYKRLILVNRKTDRNSNIIKKCNKYYKKLLSINDCDKALLNEIEYVLSIYTELKDLEIINDRYLNHGDITLDNILYSNNEYYLIDFDEVTVSSNLYDFAVIVVKNVFSNKDNKIENYINFKKIITKEFKCYKDSDYDNIVKFYLCKILLEKFYYHLIGKIDLYSIEQKRDNYKKYLEVLKEIEKHDKFGIGVLK